MEAGLKMILTPKNWKSFQHYKDRAPAWIKLHKGLLDDFEFSRLPVASKALAPMLWLLASEYEDGRIDATLDKLAFRLHMTRGDLANALSPLIDGGFFDASEPLADGKQEAIPEKEEEREIEGEKRKNSRAASPSSEDFENLRRVYPRRKGNYGWAKAEKKFNSLVKTGVDPKAILAAARQLAETLRSKIGTEYVPMPASWLNSEDFTEIAVAAFAPAELPGFYVKFGSEEQDAWDAYRKAREGKPYPRDGKGGWHQPSRWPPGYESNIIADVQKLTSGAS
ncbi:amidohydrolase [Bradyrhizobium yuanmingense]|nr:amidohydrolase [Bradyrhizobium yuanmingense]